MNVWKDLRVCKSFVRDFENLHYLLTLNDTNKESTLFCNSCKTLGNDLKVPNETYSKNDNKFLEKSNIQGYLNEESNEATILNSRLKSKFVSKNVVNLSKWKLSKPEISLLLRGLKFIPTSNTIDKAKLKTELETFGRMLQLNCFFGMMKKEFNLDKFKPKSTCNPRNKDTAIEIYLSSLQEKLMSTEIPEKKYTNLTCEEWGALFDLKNDKTIVIKGADKGVAGVVWDRGDYIQEA